MESRELSALERLIREGSDDDVRRFFLLLRPPELADVLESVPEEDRLRVVRLMSAPLASEVLRQVQEGDRQLIFEDLSARERAEIVHESKSDDAADLIGGLPPGEKQQTLEKLDREEREELEELLEYPKDSAGGLMQTELVTARADQTVKEAIAEVRGADMGDVGEIHEVFVVDAGSRLVGVISPADLLHAEPNADLHRIVESNPVCVPVTMDQEELAEKVREHDLAAVPVVDERGKLLGQVLHDDIADVIEAEATEDIAKMAGADPGEVYHLGLWKAVRSRTAWLIPAFIGGLLVAVFMSGAEEDIKAAPVLAAYLVVVVGMAGSVGTQNSALTVRSLALGSVDLSRAWRVIGRQLLMGLILGVEFGALLFLFALLFKGSDPMALKSSVTLAIAIFTAMSVGALMGVVIPLVLERVGADPAVAASPFIQTANDLVGVGILIWTARALGLL